MANYLSAAPDSSYIGLFMDLEKADPGFDRAALYERACRFICEECSGVDLTKYNVKKQYDGLTLPASFKVRINDPELDDKVNQLLRDAFKISHIMATLKLRVVLSAYLDKFNNKNTVAVDDNIDTIKLNIIAKVIGISNVDRLKAVARLLEEENENNAV